MKIAWTILLISAFTDLIITAGTALMTVMTDQGQMPSNAGMIVAILGGVVAAARTIQQALKATPETAAALKGDFSEVKTTTVEKTP